MGITIDGTEVKTVTVDGTEINEVIVDGVTVFRSSDIIYLQDILVNFADGSTILQGDFVGFSYGGLVAGNGNLYYRFQSLSKTSIGSSTFDDPTTWVATWNASADVRGGAVDGAGNLIAIIEGPKAVKYDLNGNLLWEYAGMDIPVVAFNDGTVAGRSNNGITYLDSDGNVLGSVASLDPSVDLFGTSAGELWVLYNGPSPDFPLHVAKYNASRNLVFDVNTGKEDFVNAGDCDSQGNLIVALDGGSQSAGGADILKFRNSDGLLIDVFDAPTMGDEVQDYFIDLFTDKEDRVAYWRSNYNGGSRIAYLEVIDAGFSSVVWNANFDDYPGQAQPQGFFTTNIGKRSRQS